MPREWPGIYPEGNSENGDGIWSGFPGFTTLKHSIAVINQSILLGRMPQSIKPKVWP